MSKTNLTLKERYYKEVVPYFMKEKGVKNPMAVPRVVKIVVNMGLGEALKDKNIIEKMSEQLAFITGQKPQVAKSKKAISAFKLRIGLPIGLKVTLRGSRMYDFLDKTISIVIPRVRDFRGLSKKAFDGHGNYNIGLSEMTVFPEVKFESLDKVRGFQITVVTSAKKDDLALILLGRLGFPFEK